MEAAIAHHVRNREGLGRLDRSRPLLIIGSWRIDYGRARPRLISPLLWVGLVLIVLGSGPLFAIIVAAKLGWTSDPNPNLVLLGILAMFTFWPGVALSCWNGGQPGAMATAYEAGLTGPCPECRNSRLSGWQPRYEFLSTPVRP
jgi:hypothetical protein